MTLGDIIRHHRQRLGLSQPELASRAQIEQSYLSKLENDHSYRRSHDTAAPEST